MNEILSTVMMNVIALQLMNLLLRGPLMDPAGVSAGTFLAQSERLPEQAWLFRLVPQTLLHAGLLVAILMAIVVYIFLWRTTIGYRIRAVGLNPDASRYAGIPVPFYQALSLTLAGGFAGLAGIVEVIGVHHRLLEGITSGYGFSGIVAALFGGLHPLGLLPASWLFGSLLVGADKMQRAVQVPSALIDTLLGLSCCWSSGRSDGRTGGPSSGRSLRRRRRSRSRTAAAAESAGGASMNEIATATIIVGILTSAIRLATPYLYAAIGEAFAPAIRGREPGRGRHHAGRRVRRLLGRHLGRRPLACGAGRHPRGRRDGSADGVHQRHPEGGAGHQRHRPLHVRAGALLPALQGAGRHGQDGRTASRR